jgi:hypothetical protein
MARALPRNSIGFSCYAEREWQFCCDALQGSGCGYVSAEPKITGERCAISGDPRSGGCRGIRSSSLRCPLFPSASCKRPPTRGG